MAKKIVLDGTLPSHAGAISAAAVRLGAGEKLDDQQWAAEVVRLARLILQQVDEELPKRDPDRSPYRGDLG